MSSSMSYLIYKDGKHERSLSTLLDVVLFLKSDKDPRSYTVYTTMGGTKYAYDVTYTTQMGRRHVIEFKDGVPINVGAPNVKKTTRKYLVINRWRIWDSADGTVNMRKYNTSTTYVVDSTSTGVAVQDIGVNDITFNAILMAWRIWRQSKRNISFERLMAEQK